MVHRPESDRRRHIAVWFEWAIRYARKGAEMNRRAAILAAFIAPICGRPIYPDQQMQGATWAAGSNQLIYAIEPTGYLFEVPHDWKFTFNDDQGRSFSCTGKALMDI